jgi:hypothetical protein
MEDFESKLKDLRLRQPSPELDERVLAVKAEQVRAGMCQGARRIPLWAAAAAALTAGFIGFAAGIAFRASTPASLSGSAPPASVQVIYHDPSAGDPFDFTSAGGNILPGDLKVISQTVKGIGI